MANPGPPTLDSTRPQASPWWDLVKVGAFFLLIIVATVLGVHSLSREDKSRTKLVGTTTGSPMPPETYIGAQACRECHPGECAAHNGSGHNRTLRPAGSGPLAHLLDGQRVADPETPGVTWTYAVRDGQLFVTRSEAGNARPPVRIDYAVGSGQHATTFATVLRAGEPGKHLGLEHRLTYFAHTKSLALTPGQHELSKAGQSHYGYVLTPAQIQDCINCHSTRTSARDPKTLDVETMIPNVSCERCHGPGRSHAEKAHNGATVEALAMFLSPGGDAASEVKACGTCHRLPDKFSPDEIRPDNVVIARFPSVGLLQSTCYRKSQGGLRCTSCHDPHGRVSHDQDRYANVCLACHQAASQRVCSVSPNSGCITCHMPKREIGRGLKFSDHWIRSPVGGTP